MFLRTTLLTGVEHWRERVSQVLVGIARSFELHLSNVLLPVKQKAHMDVRLTSMHSMSSVVADTKRCELVHWWSRVRTLSVARRCASDGTGERVTGKR